MQPQNFRDLISRWGRIPRFAEAMGVPYQRAFGWYRRNSIKPVYWQRLIAESAKIGVIIDGNMLLAMAANRNKADGS